jgi:hypothetical protein
VDAPARVRRSDHLARSAGDAEIVEWKGPAVTSRRAGFLGIDYGVNRTRRAACQPKTPSTMAPTKANAT